MKHTIVLLLVLSLLLAAAATAGLTPKLELSGSAGVIGGNAFSDNIGLRATAAIEVTPGFAVGAFYERLSGDYLINSSAMLFEKSIRYDIVGAFVSARVIARDEFSLWHGLSCGTLTDDTTVSWSTLDFGTDGYEGDGQSVALDTWLRTVVPVGRGFGVTGAFGVRFLGIGDLDGAEERGLDMFGIPYEDNKSASQGRIYFRLGAEARF